MKSVYIATGLLLLGFLPQVAVAQIGGVGAGTPVGGAGGDASAERGAGLTQSGQVSSSAGIQREEGAFIGRSATDHPRTMANANVASANAGFAQQSATNTGGLGGLTSNLGRAGGIGGLGTTGLGRGNTLGGGFGGNQFGGNNQFGGANQFGNQNGAQAQAQIRYRLFYAEAVPSRPFPAASTPAIASFQGRLPRIPILSKNPSINLALQGRTLVMSGKVATEREKMLMGRMAELEPGVSKVQNNLQVETTTVAGSVQ